MGSSVSYHIPLNYTAVDMMAKSEVPLGQRWNGIIRNYPKTVPVKSLKGSTTVQQIGTLTGALNGHMSRRFETPPLIGIDNAFYPADSNTQIPNASIALSDDDDPREKPSNKVTVLFREKEWELPMAIMIDNKHIGDMDIKMKTSCWRKGSLIHFFWDVVGSVQSQWTAPAGTVLIPVYILNGDKVLHFSLRSALEPNSDAVHGSTCEDFGGLCDVVLDGSFQGQTAGAQARNCNR